MASEQFLSEIEISTQLAIQNLLCIPKSVLDVFAEGSGSRTLRSLERELTWKTKNSSDISNSDPSLSLPFHDFSDSPVGQLNGKSMGPGVRLLAVEFWL